MRHVIGGENVRDLGAGIFEDLLTGRLAKQLEGLRDLVDSVEEIPKPEAPAALARFLGPAIEAKLRNLDPEQMVSLSNSILDLLDHADEVLPGPRNLLSLTRDGDIRRRSFKRPQTPLSEAALLTNGRDDLNRKAYGSHIVLFTRDVAEDSNGMAQPFTCLGPVDYVQHKGAKPIAITWKLQREMPVDVFTAASAVAR